jgi:branched-chain amino acid transport system substrate-binding protein
LARRAAAIAACAGLAVAGCGGGGIEEGATVRVYAAAPLCAGAKRELFRHGARAGAVQVQVLCLAAAPGGGGTLASVGANARRATQDSSTVGYIGEATPQATKFSSTILESAGIAQLSGMSGGSAMARLLSAIEAAGKAGNLREVVDEKISGG